MNFIDLHYISEIDYCLSISIKKGPGMHSHDPGGAQD
jgi:hypothetical protein